MSDLDSWKLRAIRARLEGNWDDEALRSYGEHDEPVNLRITLGEILVDTDQEEGVQTCY